MGLAEALSQQQAVIIQQRRELAELIGFETRNKYMISTEGGAMLAYAAEQRRGWLDFLTRQFLGHWRSFEIHVFDQDRNRVLLARHPFRWIFQRLEISGPNGRPLGALEKRLSLLGKRFDLEDGTGKVRMTVSSPLWKIWTFPFMKGGRQVAVVTKKWGGLLAEAFTDQDRFRVEYQDPGLTAEERLLLLAAALFIDLQYFENAGGGAGD